MLLIVTSTLYEHRNIESLNVGSEHWGLFYNICYSNKHL